MSNVLAWARQPERLRFHLLAEEQGLLRSGVAVLAANAGLPLSVINATDTAMVARLPPLGLSMLRHPALQGKPRLYTTPKLFLFALLDVPMALVLDTDVLVMADVCDAWDAFAARAAREPRMLFSYAREQQPGYRVLTHNRSRGYNGGVGLQHLQRLRASTEREPFANALERALASPLLRRDGPLAEGGEASWTSGDQDLLVLLELLTPSRDWNRWMAPLECSWNWQLCFSIIAAEGGRGYAAANDDTCAQPPRLLHFNCLRSLKDLLRRERLYVGSSGPNATAHNRRAARHCNVSFLFERTRGHQARPASFLEVEARAKADLKQQVLRDQVRMVAATW